MINVLNKLINDELSKANCHDGLIKLISKQSRTLGTLLTLPGPKAESLLLNFVTRYIQATPAYIDAFAGLSQLSNADDYVKPFLEQAMTLCHNSHPVADATSGSHALLCKTYMAHRIMEELNDHIAIKRQLALAPIEMGHTNLIVHTLIGDEPANLLDQTVLIQFELISATIGNKAKQAFESAKSEEFIKQTRREGWESNLKTWPCLKEDLALLLD